MIGDKVVCIKDFQIIQNVRGFDNIWSLTKGNVYQITNFEKSYAPVGLDQDKIITYYIGCDVNHRHYDSWGFNEERFKEYFVLFEQWREDRINSLIELA
jgi:hypothetical protein